MIYNIAFSLSILLFFIESYRTFKRGNYISIQIILSGCFLLFLLLPPYLDDSYLVRDDDYNLLFITALVGLFIACRLIPYNIASEKQFYEYNVKIKWKKIGFYIFIFYLLFDIISMIVQKGSLMAIFTSSRLEFDEMSTSGNLVGRIMVFFKYLFYIRIYDFFKKKKHKKFLFFYFIPMFHHQVTAITRFDFLIMLLILVFLYLEPLLKIRKKISLLKLSLFIIPLFFLVFSYMYFSNIVRHGLLLENHSKSFNLSDNSITHDLEYYYLLNDLYEAKNTYKISLEYGSSWFYYPFITYFPRQFWPDKPLTAFSTRYTEKLYWKIGNGPVATFTIFGEGYLQFGLLGVLLAPIIFAYTRWVSISYIKKINNSRIVIYLIIFSMITFFRAEQPIVYVALDIVYTYIIINFMSLKRIKT